jgi:hypothetical protein
MNIDTIVEIHTFDDGNQRYKEYDNKWKIIETMFNGGKLKLMNCDQNDIIICSISAWKTKLNFLKKF